MWKDLLLFPVVFICSVIIVSLSVLGLFSIDSFLSFILRSSVCMYIHNTKIFQQKNCKKKWFISKQIRAMCVCVCVCVCEWPLLLSPNFFSDFFFPWISGGGNKNDNFKKKKISTGEEKNSADHLHKHFFFIGTRGGPAFNYLKKKTTDLHEIKQWNTQPWKKSLTILLIYSRLWKENTKMTFYISSFFFLLPRSPVPHRDSAQDTIHWNNQQYPPYDYSFIGSIITISRVTYFFFLNPIFPCPLRLFVVFIDYV